ncbi:MAG: hypothetical protein IVW57_02605 [Ktedonobacterales bacterium]|nr:hypothetical protein [Ktedonobacterales bacterium]
MGIFAVMGRARARLPLTPGERALLKLAQGLLVSGVIAALLTAGHALESDGPVAWRRVVLASAVAALVAVLNALAKYYRAQGDTPISEALAYLANQAEQRGGRNAAKVPLVPPASGDEGGALPPGGIALN